VHSVSVIIPTYNREASLIAAVMSALRQTHPVEEILVCDDGSTDNSRDRITALNEPRVKWLDCGRWGRPAGPRNVGLKNARGNYVAFLDSDDEWLPGKLEAQIGNLSEGIRAVCTNAVRRINGVDVGDYLQSVPARLSTRDLLKTNFVVCSSMMVERELALQCGGFPEQQELRALEDYSFWLRVSALTGIQYLSTALTVYNDSPSESIRGDDVDHNEQKRRVLRNFLTWLESREGGRSELAMTREMLLAVQIPWYQRVLKRLRT